MQQSIYLMHASDSYLEFYSLSTKEYKIDKKKEEEEEKEKKKQKEKEKEEKK